MITEDYHKIPRYGELLRGHKRTRIINLKKKTTKIKTLHSSAIKVRIYFAQSMFLKVFFFLIWKCFEYSFYKQMNIDGLLPLLIHTNAKAHCNNEWGLYRIIQSILLRAILITCAMVFQLGIHILYYKVRFIWKIIFLNLIYKIVQESEHFTLANEESIL